MSRPLTSSRLDPETRRRANAAAARAARLHQRRERAESHVGTLTTERNRAWNEAVGLGMSRSEVARMAGVHHSAVDRVVNDAE